MTHYVLFKFRPGYSMDQIQDWFDDTYKKMPEQIPGIGNIKLMMNCHERDTNMDMMISMEMRDEKLIDSYLHHPLHLAFVKKTSPDLVSHVSFDTMD